MCPEPLFYCRVNSGDWGFAPHTSKRIQALGHSNFSKTQKIQALPNQKSKHMVPEPTRVGLHCARNVESLLIFNHKRGAWCRVHMSPSVPCRLRARPSCKTHVWLARSRRRCLPAYPPRLGTVRNALPPSDRPTESGGRTTECGGRAEVLRCSRLACLCSLEPTLQEHARSRTDAHISTVRMAGRCAARLRLLAAALLTNAPGAQRGRPQSQADGYGAVGHGAVRRRALWKCAARGTPARAALEVWKM